MPATVLDDIRSVQANVRAFARHQRDSLADFEVEMTPGVHLGQRNIPVHASGAYVPGGRYPLVASAHMTVVSAKVAGVERVAACTPPIRGEIPAATIAALSLADADEIYLVAGSRLSPRWRWAPRPSTRSRSSPVPATPTSPRHVEVLTAEPRRALDRMTNYGALFLGEATCVSYGDKVIGTNHVLPTRGAARYTGGLWVGKYLKTVTYQEVTDPAASARLGQLCGRASRVELFEGHARSGDVRAAKYAGDALDWAPASATGRK